MTTHTCPKCRFQFCDEDEEREARIAARVASWEAKCAAAPDKLPIRDGRVSELTAGELMGLTDRRLRKHRREHDGPRFVYLPVVGSRRSYYLTELAAWLETRESGESCI